MPQVCLHDVGAVVVVGTELPVMVMQCSWQSSAVVVVAVVAVVVVVVAVVVESVEQEEQR